MAITFGNTSDNASQGTTSWSHNSNGDFLLVGVNDTAGTVSGVTYNGVAMTQIGTTFNYGAIGRYIQLWGLVAPASGSNTIAITGGANQNAGAVSISGVNQTSVVAAATGFASNSTSASPSTVSVTTTVDNAYVVGFGYAISYTSIGTGTTDISNIHDANNRFIRSTSAITPAGASSVNMNMNGSLLGGLVGVGINPAPVTSGNMFALF